MKVSFRGLMLFLAVLGAVCVICIAGAFGLVDLEKVFRSEEPYEAPKQEYLLFTRISSTPGPGESWYEQMLNTVNSYSVDKFDGTSWSHQGTASCRPYQVFGGC